ncbi:lipid droplet-associated protein [Gordonia sp. CPCC 205333]|uniref:lipid droplet-associated protein n=1 Tax=Gordonia sp. CPCC 205333 TaxID=3140790 RepID=UPI003AF376A4
MIRPPYTARVAAGLLATVVEETKKLPTYAVTLPMTAVSQALQAGMRMQQNVAELAIKGDTVFDGLFGQTEEQPSWAVFDEDAEAAAPAIDKPAPASATRTPEPTGAAAPTPAESAPIKAVKTAPKPAKRAPANSAATKSAPAKAAKTTAKRAKRANPTATNAAAKPTGDSPASTGRFALYSSTPDDIASTTPTKNDAAEFDGIVGELDYDALTLAQLRAKLRTIELDDLRTLAEYEKANRARTPFLTMLENRIATKSEK